MKKIGRMLAALLAAALLCAAMGVLFVACGEGTEEPPQTDPVKVADGIDFDLAVGTEREFAVADYITANGNAVSASSAEETVASAAVEGGTLTVSALSAGETTVTLTCGEVTVTFGVTVYRTFTVSVDGEETQVRENGTFTLPAAPVPKDENMQFAAWLVGGERKQPQDVITVTADVTVTAVYEPKAPVKVKDGEAIEIAFGGSERRNVADYITTYGNEVTASVGTEGIVTANVAEGTLTVAADAKGEAEVTLSCGEVEVTFSVTVYNVYTVTVGSETTQVREGGTFELPAAIAPEDQNFEFVAWQVGQEQKQPGAEITVNENLTITAVTRRKAPVKVKDGETFVIAFGGNKQITVADYITTYGNAVSASVTPEGIVAASVAGGVLTVTAIRSGEAKVTLSCGEVEAVFGFTVQKPDVDAPAYANGTISFDLFNAASGSFTFVPTAPEGVSYTYAYSLAEQDGNAQISDGALTYTATEPVSKVLTVNVTATATVSGETIEKQGSFTVTITVTDTTPAVIESAIAADGTVDLYDHADGYTIDLTANIENAGNVTSYTVAVGDEEAAPVENAEEYVFTGSYSDTAQQVTLTVTALFGEKSVSYTYTLSVIDSTAYRMPNGALEDVTGWSGMTGIFSNNSTYWDKHETNNDGYYYVGVDGATDTLSGTETVTSPTFVVGGSGWITFKLGSMRPNEGTTLRNIYLEVVEDAADGDDVVLARVRNILFKDPEAALRLNDYKLDLSAYKGKTVYLRAVDNEKGDNFRSLYLDSFVTWYAAEPAADTYTDLSKAYYLDTAVALDLAAINTATVVPVLLSEGLLNKEYTYTASVSKDGLTAEGLTLTATKSGVYTVTYTVSYGEEEIGSFSVTVTVTNTTQLPEFENAVHSYAYGEWQADRAVEVPLPEDGERFSYSYSVSEGTAIIDGKTLTYTPSAAGSVQITVTVTLTDKNYPDTDLPTLSFTVTLNFADNEITLAGGNNISVAFDVNDAEIVDKEVYTLDFAKYLLIPEDKTVSYAVTMNEKSIVLDGSSYTLVFAELGLNETEQEFVFAVTATSGGKQLEYTVTLHIKDTYQYRLFNGGFETGNLTGWELTGDIGVVSQDSTYWNNPDHVYGKEGEYLFTWWSWDAQANEGKGDEVNREGNTGTLKSSAFTLRAGAIVSFLFGGGVDNEQIYLEFVNAETDEVLAKFFNTSPSDGRLVKYWYEFAEVSEDTQCYIRVTDNAKGGWGCFALDGVETNLAAKPDGYNLAVNQLSADV